MIRASSASDFSFLSEAISTINSGSDTFSPVSSASSALALRVPVRFSQVAISFSPENKAES